MKVSIIIPVYNRIEYTRKCLESVFEFGSKYDFEIIVVDNYSTDGTKEYLDGLGEKITAVHNKENLGFARASNMGAKHAKGEYLLFLNNDTIVTKNWMDILVRELDNNQNVAIAGSKLLFPDETIQHAGVVFDENKLPYHIYAREIKEKDYVNKKRTFNALTAACMLVRKSIFNEVGCFDENFLNGYEDIDLCLKIKELGMDIMYCPESVLYHYESISEGRGDKYKENRELFLEKWGNKIEQDDYAYMMEDKTLDQTMLIESQKKEIARLERRLSDKDIELGVMTSSKFWKLRTEYMKLKVLFSKKFIKKSCLRKK